MWTTINFQRSLRGLRRQIKSLKRQGRNDRRLLWVETLISNEQYDEAMGSIDKYLKGDPQNALFVMTKARILKRQALLPDQPDREKLLEQALDCIDRAIALRPDMGEAFYNKACYLVLLNLKGMKSEVLENLKSAFRLNPALRQTAKDDGDLAELKQDADFVKLIGQD